MNLVVGLFGLFVAALGAAGAFSPERILTVVTRAQSRLGVHAIAAFRLAIGGAMLLAAPSSRAPLYLNVLGVLSIVSGVLSLLLGPRRFEAVLAWWRSRSERVVRLWSAFVLAFGLSIVVASFRQVAG